LGLDPEKGNLANARDALDQSRFYDATVSASRSLLVTQGQEAKEDAEALELFTSFFVEPQLVDGSFRETLEKARSAATAGDPELAFEGDPEEVAALVETVEALYDNMDSSLRFKPVQISVVPERGAGNGETEVSSASRNPAESPSDGDIEADREVEFLNVACPMNYVKTKLVLEEMEKGQVLSVLLNDEGARNVPRSTEGDGNQVLSVDQMGENRWRLLIRKG